MAIWNSLILLYVLWPVQRMDVAAMSDTCASSELNEISALGNQGSSVLIGWCNIGIAVRTSSISWRHNGEVIPINRSKYSESSGSLRVNDIVVEDEGTYGCNVNGGEWQDIAYLYVLGRAQFHSCGQRSCDEVESIHSYIGSTIEFNTKVTFSGAGRCNRNQTATILQLVRQPQEGRSREVLYTCTTFRQHHLCGSAGRIKVIQGMQIFDITLALQNVTVADSGMYTAVIEAIKPDTGATASVSKGFDVVIEAALPKITIKSTSLAVSGHNYSLSCIVEIIQSSCPVSVQWLDSSNKVVASDGIIHVKDQLVVGNTTVATLVFSPLNVVHEGSYTCQVEVQYSSSGRTVVEETKVIAVHSASIMEVHVFVMNATHVNVSWSVVTSQEIRVVEFTVFYSAGSSSFDRAGHFSIPAHAHYIVVKIDPTPRVRHYFQVEGTVTTDHSQSFIAVKSELAMIEFDEAVFQLRIGQVNCASWDTEEARLMEMSIRKEIARAITHQCNCTFDPGFIKPGKFICRNTLGNQVTYRSTLLGGSVHTANNLLQFIKEWVQSAPALCTEVFILDVDPNCPAQIQSLTDPECVPSSTVPIAANETLTTTESTVIQCLRSCVSSI